ncbi:MAG: ATP-dependent DNA helicase [Candidatus Nanopelagicales bacterium]
MTTDHHHDPVYPAMYAGLGFHPSEAQWNAISAPLRPASIVAGAGTGKTAVMAARVLWSILTEAVAPDAVLGLTFTNKAAAELLQRIRSHLGAVVQSGHHQPVVDAGEPTVSTYHSFGAAIISEYGPWSGLESNGEVLTEVARAQLATRVVSETDLDMTVFDVSPPTVAAMVSALDNTLSDLDISTTQLRAHSVELQAQLHRIAQAVSLQKAATEILHTAGQRIVLADLVDQFRESKSQRHLIDFADQLRLSLQLVRTFPQITTDLRSRFALVLLDEYQDTSVSQRKLLQEVFGQGHPITAVGDPCQSIYGWRGASVDNIDQFGHHFPRIDNPDFPVPADQYPLTQNRRSAPEIIELANEIARPLREVHAGVQPLQSAPDVAKSGHLRVGLWDTADDEIEWVADSVAAASAAPDATCSDILVLARTGDQLRLMAKALRARRVPVQISSGQALFTHPVVIELIAYMQVAHDPTANTAFVRIASGPRWRIGPRDLAILGRFAESILDPTEGYRSMADRSLPERVIGSVEGIDPSEQISLSDACFVIAAPSVETAGIHELSGQARQRLTQLAQQIQRLRRHSADSPRDLVQRILSITGAGVEFLVGDPDQAADNARAIQELINLAGKFNDLDSRTNVAAFLAYVAAVHSGFDGPDIAPGPTRDAVRVMTVHSAKGLEAPQVFIIGLTKSLFPSAKAVHRWPKRADVVPWALRNDAPPNLVSFPPLQFTPAKSPTATEFKEFNAASREYELIEERRLLYVAVTRAAHQLTLTGHGWKPYSATFQGASDFLWEAYDFCQDHQGEIVHWVEDPAKGATNPLFDQHRVGVRWMSAEQPEEIHQRASAAVRQAMSSLAGNTTQELLNHLSPQVQSALAQSQQEASSGGLPGQVSVTELTRYLADAPAMLAIFDRPMPRPPSAAAHRGAWVHSWIEQQLGSDHLLDLDDIPGSADDELTLRVDPIKLKEAFAATPFAHLAPLAVEHPFILIDQGHAIKGRIDAVFRRGDRDVVVDWKTGIAGSADQAQLDIYRRAWASITGVSEDQVDAEFVYLPLT